MINQETKERDKCYRTKRVNGKQKEEMLNKKSKYCEQKGKFVYLLVFFGSWVNLQEQPEQLFKIPNKR